MPAAAEADDEQRRALLQQIRLRDVISLEGCHATTSFFAPPRSRPIILAARLIAALNAVVRHAPAQRPVHGLADLRVRRLRVFVEQRLGGHDLPVLAEAALRHLLVDPGLLQRMQLAVLGQPFERGDLALHGRRRA